MKRFLVVLLSLALIVAFSMSAYAATPNFTGEYWARYQYMDNPTLLDKNGGRGRASYSEWDQQLRFFMEVKPIEGVSLTTRVDILETVWGVDQQLYAPTATNPYPKVKDVQTGAASFERSDLRFGTGIGDFRIGYRSGTHNGWGTKFMNAPGTVNGVKWSNKFGGLSVLADFSKSSKGDFKDQVPGLLATDIDKDLYNVGVEYKFQGGQAGLLWSYFLGADKRLAAAPYKQKVHNFAPYVITKLGPVNVEAEAYWMTGKFNEYETPTAARPDVDYTGRGAYINGKFNMGPAYLGAIVLYASGDDPGTTDKIEGGGAFSNNYSTWKLGDDSEIWGDITPAILFADNYNQFLANRGGDATANAFAPTGSVDNVWMYQLYGGYAATKKLDFNFKLSFLKADQAPVVDTAAAQWQSKNYGTELDLKGTYKIFDSLTYNVGAAYLWTGDFFKGTNPAASLTNNYYLSHWIKLTF